LNNLDISIFHIDNSVLINLNGFLDASGSPTLHSALEKFIEDNPFLISIIFNLKDLTYISSSGVGVFTYFWAFAQRRNIEVYFCNIKPKVESVLNTLGFMPHLSVIEPPKQKGSKIL